MQYNAAHFEIKDFFRQNLVACKLAITRYSNKIKYYAPIVKWI